MLKNVVLVGDVVEGVEMLVSVDLLLMKAVVLIGRVLLVIFVE